MKKNAVDFKNTYTYHATIDLPVFDCYLVNHGTESKLQTRASQHISECAENGLVYNVLEEKQDRLFGTDVIAPAQDKVFIAKLVDRLNNINLKKSANKAMTLKNWKAGLGILPSIKRGYYDAIEKSNLSETELAVIPKEVTLDQLKAAIKYVEDTWYYVTSAIRVSAKPYSQKTKKARAKKNKPKQIVKQNKEQQLAFDLRSM